jgi:simple sugar transport system substrate-binding protein
MTDINRADMLRLGVAAAAGSKLAGARTTATTEFLQPHPNWRIVFVNHALTNPFFVPAKYGSQDAASLLGVRARWTGSASSNVAEMVKAMERAIEERVAGIAVSLIDPEAFNELTALALRRGIPVVSYNADGGTANTRLAYIGQDNYQSGLELGARVVSLVADGDVFLFIATPGQANIQPRIDGALDAIRDSGKTISAHVVASGVDVSGEQAKVEQTYLANRDLRGLFAVDAGSTAGVAAVMRKHGLHARGVRAGGYDLLPETLEAISEGDLDFAIDQQPYLQGFLPVQQLFFDRYSDGLVAPADTNTGVNFVTRANVQPYVTTRTRYEGSSGRESFPAARK